MKIRIDLGSVSEPRPSTKNPNQLYFRVCDVADASSQNASATTAVFAGVPYGVPGSIEGEAEIRNFDSGAVLSFNRLTFKPLQVPAASGKP